jgi:hypothetical protein
MEESWQHEGIRSIGFGTSPNDYNDTKCNGYHAMQRQLNELDDMATNHDVLSLVSTSTPRISNAQGVLKRADDSENHFLDHQWPQLDAIYCIDDCGVSNSRLELLEHVCLPFNQRIWRVFLLVFVLFIVNMGDSTLEHWSIGLRMDSLIDFRYPVDVKVVFRCCKGSTNKCGQDSVKASRLSLGELNFPFTVQIRSKRQ